MLHPGDHVCALYGNDAELADIVADFLVEGLRKKERCWYLPASDDPAAIRAALAARRIDVKDVVGRGALQILPSNAVYDVHGDFHPEETMHVFSAAIEDALSDGFNGLRAAANMSWALDLVDGAQGLITYEALLRSLFSTSPATGLCLYDRTRMPLAVIDGALSTHPIVRSDGSYRGNAFYDVGVHTLRDVDPGVVAQKLARIGFAAEMPADRSKMRRGGC